MWAPQGLCDGVVGSENRFHAALGHLAVMKRLLLSGLQGRSDPAFPKPDNSVHPDLSAPALRLVFVQSAATRCRS